VVTLFFILNGIPWDVELFGVIGLLIVTVELNIF
jgi:hypothetical protein